MTVQAIGSTSAKIAIVGEFPSEQDLRAGQPFCSGFGEELQKMLLECGIPLASCYTTLVLQDRVVNGRVDGLVATKKKDITQGHVYFQGRYVLPRVREEVLRLKAELEVLQPNVVCAVGNLALFALTGEWGVGQWRGSVMESTLIPGLKVIPTLSPNVLYTQWKQRPIILNDLKRVARQGKFPGVSPLNYSIVIRPSFEQAHYTLTEILCLAKGCAAAGTKLRIGADIETRAGHIACIAFAWTETNAITIPLMCQHSALGYWTLEEETALILLMVDILRVVKVVGQNWNYDAQYIHRHWGFLCPDVVDTMIQQHSCFSNLEKNLAFLSSMYLENHLYWKDDRTNWDTGPKGDGEDVYWRYNATDALRTLAIHNVLSSVVEALQLGPVNDFQQAHAPRVLKTMNRGVRIDQDARAALSLTLQAEVAAREAWMETVIGHPLNIKSPKQMAEFFYEEMGQKPIRKRNAEGGLSITADDEAMHKIADREPLLRPITRKVAELRSLGVFHSTFVQAPLDIDGRMRCSFNLCGTKTYRFASSKNAFGSGMNMQNIPKGGETEDGGLELPNVRQLFIPDAGHTMFDIDLDSADLRIVTWESDCAWMKEHFRAGRKPYVEVMREYYRNPAMTKSSHPREYAMFKSLCHGTNYLGTADGIAPRIGLLVHETERIQKWYFGLAPEIAKWQERIKKQVMRQRFVSNAFGYRMNIFDKIEGTIFNEAVAWIPQSTVGILINHIWAEIDAHIAEAEVLIQVHDSLVGQFPTVGDAEEAAMLARIIDTAQVVIPYEDPLIIPVGIAHSRKNWGDCR